MGHMKTAHIMAAAMLIAAKALSRCTWHRLNRREPNEPICSGTICSAPGREVPSRCRVDVQTRACSLPDTRILAKRLSYVIEGSLEYEIDGKISQVKAGDVLFVPAGAIHTAKNVGSGNGAQLYTYIVEKGKPLLTGGQVTGIGARQDRTSDESRPGD